MATKYYVYRFKDIDGNVIYVGKTNNLTNRMATHFGINGHLDPKCYGSVEKIEYIEFKNKLDMDVKEIYYIDLFKPIYNKVNKREGRMETEFVNKDEWKTFVLKNNEYVEKLEEELKELEALNKETEKNLIYYKKRFHELNNEKASKADETIKLHRELKEVLENRKEIRKIGDEFIEGNVTGFLDNNPNKIVNCRIEVHGRVIKDYVVYSEESGHHFVELISGNFSDVGYRDVPSRCGRFMTNPGLMSRAKDWVIIDAIGGVEASIEDMKGMKSRQKANA